MRAEHYLGFGQLPLSCYNGWGHMVNAERPIPIYLTTDSNREDSLTSVVIINDEKGKLSGSHTKIMGKMNRRKFGKK